MGGPKNEMSWQDVPPVPAEERDARHVPLEELDRSITTSENVIGDDGSSSIPWGAQDLEDLPGYLDELKSSKLEFIVRLHLGITEMSGDRLHEVLPDETRSLEQIREQVIAARDKTSRGPAGGRAYAEGLTFDEIALLLNRSRARVSTQFEEARRRLNYMHFRKRFEAERGPLI